MIGASKVYDQLIKDNQIETNANQKNLVIELDKFLSNNKKNFVQKLFQSKRYEKKCFYLHGGVGIGKTLIMDLFYNEPNLYKKRRVHFHEFMIDIHDQLHKLRSEKNSKDFIISKLVKEIKLDSNFLFFDEFQVTNIADAMILGHLFEAFFKYNIIIILTSNSSPEELYKDGLQRDLFLPFISLIRENSLIHDLSINIDYRTRSLSEGKNFFLSTSPVSKLKIKDIYDSHSNKTFIQDRVISVKKRDFIVKNVSNNIAWFQFTEICGDDRGTEDYLEMIKIVKILIIENVPSFDNSNANLQERFINLIDVLYDNKIKLYLSSAKEINKLGSAYHLKTKFNRTISRLLEMKSQ